jgi:lysophospholipase L1-like esterase
VKLFNHRGRNLQPDGKPTMTIRRHVALAVTLIAFGTSAIAQQAPPPHNPVDTLPAPPEVTDTALRQVTPAPQSRWGFINGDWYAHHEKNVAEAHAHSYDLVFVGDSITDNFHKPGPAPDKVFKPIWDELFAPHGALNLGVSGDSTQHVLWRLDHGEVDGLAPSNIVLMIGTNNTWHDGRASAQDVTAGIEAVVTSLHTHMPKAKILVLGILPTTVGAPKTEKDEAVNAAVAKFYAHSDYVRTLDLKSLFMTPDGKVDESLFYDQPGPCTGPNCDPNAPPPPRKVVHPNTVGQRKWAEAVAAALYGGPSH